MGVRGGLKRRLRARDAVRRHRGNARWQWRRQTGANRRVAERQIIGASASAAARGICAPFAPRQRLTRAEMSASKYVRDNASLKIADASAQGVHHYL